MSSLAELMRVTHREMDMEQIRSAVTALVRSGTLRTIKEPGNFVAKSVAVMLDFPEGALSPATDWTDWHNYAEFCSPLDDKFKLRFDLH